MDEQLNEQMDEQKQRKRLSEDHRNVISRHRMRFGAEVENDGRVRFSIFAPAATSIEVEIDGKKALPLSRSGNGWYELTTDAAKPGSLYRFILPNGRKIADPASRYQPQDVHGPSEVIDPRGFGWSDAGWKGRPWQQAVLYELHVGTFTPEGTFSSATSKLDYLAELGVTAIEIMCLADFAGTRNWGYDGVLLYAPDSAYGRPEDLKAFINGAHARGLMVILDVVYNHFGPEGNDLEEYFPAICSERHCTPWGKALNFDGPGSEEVRAFIIHNALYWIEEFHIDGLRLDASHAMIDESEKHILDELKEAVATTAGDRITHLILENEDNIAERLTRDDRGNLLDFAAQWNHDITHLLAAVLGKTCEERQADDGGETDRLGKSLATGFVIAAEEKGKVEYECRVPPTAFIAFVQTHDLIGNRIFGERIHSIAAPEAVRAITAICLLLPQIPMLFMGEEWGASTPFPFFCDYHGELADQVRKGRYDQLSKQDPAPSAEEMRRAPDPQAEETMRSAQLKWDEVGEGSHASLLDWHKRILRIRQQAVVPLLRDLPGTCGTYQIIGPGALEVNWTLTGGADLRLAINLCSQASLGFSEEAGREIWREGSGGEGAMGPWSVCWRILE